jgi:hypothetical protein
MQKQRAVRVRRDPTECARILKRLETSNKPQVEFCHALSLSVKTLQKWARRLKAATRSGFVALSRSVTTADGSTLQIEVQLPAGVSIRMPS